MRLELKVLIVAILLLIYSAVVLNFTIKASSVDGASSLKGISATLVALSSIAIVLAGIFLARSEDFKSIYGNKL